MSFGRSRRAVLGSTIIALISGSLVLYLYAQLLAEQRPEGAVSGIPFGTFGSLVMSQERCIGWVRSEFEYDGSYSLIMDAELAYSLSGRSAEIEVRGGFAFNSLQQLTGIYVRLLSGDSREIALRTSGVNPILLSVKGSLNQSSTPLSFERSFPGPVQLFELPDGSYSLRAQAIPGFEQISSRIGEGAPFKMGALLSTEEIAEATEEELRKACDARGAGTLSLDSLVGLMQRVQSLQEVS